MASEHSHEKLCEAVDTVFDTILTNFDPELTTELEIEQTVYDYLVSNFELSPCDQLYVKADIGDINYLDEGEININNYIINVIHTPGHTIGGCLYLFKDEKVIFMGDTIICESIGRYDLPTSNEYELIYSLKKIKKLNLSDDITCYFGHGYSLTYKNLLAKNYYLKNV